MLKSKTTDEPTRQKPRFAGLLPGVVIVALQWLIKLVVPIVVPEVVLKFET